MKNRWLLTLAFFGLVAAFSVPFAMRKLNPYGPIAGNTVPPSQPLPAFVRSLHPNYPYSVIPGGAYSAAELRYVNRKDDAVRAHYADFNLRTAHLVQLTEDHYQYVSYRVKNQIYWTKKRLRIPQGEYLLTDGVHFARTRCGNRLSDTPRQQISSSEPDPTMLSQPPIRPEFLAKLDLTQSPPLGDLGQEFPEPASIYLFVVTFLLSLWMLTRLMSADEETEGSHPPESAE